MTDDGWVGRCGFEAISKLECPACTIIIETYFKCEEHSSSLSRPDGTAHSCPLSTDVFVCLKRPLGTIERDETADSPCVILVGTLCDVIPDTWGACRILGRMALVVTGRKCSTSSS